MECEDSDEPTSPLTNHVADSSDYRQYPEESPPASSSRLTSCTMLCLTPTPDYAFRLGHSPGGRLRQAYSWGGLFLALPLHRPEGQSLSDTTFFLEVQTVINSSMLFLTSRSSGVFSFSTAQIASLAYLMHLRIGDQRVPSTSMHSFAARLGSSDFLDYH